MTLRLSAADRKLYGMSFGSGPPQPGPAQPREDEPTQSSPSGGGYTWPRPDDPGASPPSTDTAAPGHTATDPDDATAEQAPDTTVAVPDSDLEPREPIDDFARRRLFVVGAAILVVVALVFGIRAATNDGGTEPRTLLAEGLEAHQEGRANDAARTYRQVLVDDPANKFAYFNLGLIHHNAGRVKPAELNYRLAIHYDAKFEPALFNLAIVLTPSAPEEAESLYRRLIELKPNNGAAHLNLGYLLRSIGREEEGDEAIARAAELGAVPSQ